MWLGGVVITQTFGEIYQVMRIHDLTNKKTTTKTKTMTIKNTFREHPKRGISEDI